MKLQAILLSALVGLSSATTNLRAIFGDGDDANLAEPLNVESYLTVEGLHSEPTDEDAHFIDLKLRQAIKDMTMTLGWRWYCPRGGCGTRCYTSTIGCSSYCDPNYCWPGYRFNPAGTGWHPDCRVSGRCRYDDDIPYLGAEEKKEHGIVVHSSLSFTKVALAQVQAGSEKYIGRKLCAALRKSGIDNLRDAKDCKLSLMERPDAVEGCSKHGPIVADLTIIKDGHEDVEDLEDGEIELFKATVKDVYNKVFHSAGKGMKHFDIDEWYAIEDATKMFIHGSFEPLCPNDDDHPSKGEPMDFHTALCDGFKNSGIPAFGHIRSCEFFQEVGKIDFNEASSEALTA